MKVTEASDLQVVLLLSIEVNHCQGGAAGDRAQLEQYA